MPRLHGKHMSVMPPPTLCLYINIKHDYLQTLARQEEERLSEETCKTCVMPF